MPRHLALWTATLFAFSCSPAGGDAGNRVFTFSTSEESTLTIRVLQGTTPVTGALISVVDPMEETTPEATEGEVAQTWFQGLTNRQGLCEGILNSASTATQFDIVVQAPGLTGSYEVEALRTRWGPFAPSARIRVNRTAEINTTIQLTAK